MAVRDRESIEVPAATTEKNFLLRVSRSLAELRREVPNTGRAILNFGVAPGVLEASTIITDQKGITALAFPFAWLLLEDTVDHTAAEHRLATFRVSAGAVVPGPRGSLTVYGTSSALLTGQWAVAWSWR